MKHVKQILLPAALLAAAGLSGCKGDNSHSSGMPVIDRWMSPAPSMQPQYMEQGDPYQNEPQSPVPAPEPEPPSALIQPKEAINDPEPRLIIPSPDRKPDTAAIDRSLDLPDNEFFEDEAGYVPLPSR